MGTAVFGIEACLPNAEDIMNTDDHTNVWNDFVRILLLDRITKRLAKI